MFDFSGFSEFDFAESLPSASITKNGITFNRGVVSRLGRPSRAVLLINPDQKQIAIRGCDENAPRSNSFYRDNGRGVTSVRWNAKSLIVAIKEMMGWDLESESYRVDGQFFKEDETMLFDLNKAKTIE